MDKKSKQHLEPPTPPTVVGTPTLGLPTVAGRKMSGRPTASGTKRPTRLPCSDPLPKHRPTVRTSLAFLYYPQR